MQFVKMHGLGNDFIIFPEEETGGSLPGLLFLKNL